MHFHRPSGRLACFPRAPARLYGFKDTHCRLRRQSTPFEPFEPYEPFEPFLSQPFYTTRRRQAATTLGAQPRQPSRHRCVQRRSLASFFIICGEAATTTLRAKGPVKLKNPPAAGRSILRTFSFTTLLHNLPPTGGHNLRPGGPSTLRPKGRVKIFQKTC